MTTTLSGPMFEPAESALFKSLFSLAGAHYNIYHFDSIDALRCIFPSGAADEFNLVLFSTSGVHGSYVTIEEIEASLRKYGDKNLGEDELPDDWHDPVLTVLIIHPRIVCLRYGCIKVSLNDIEWLKSLRASSWIAFAKIGAHLND